LLIVPTNASSYRTSQVPTQEVAAAQLRAWETGRDTVQAAPTGFSALIDHDGRVLARSTLGRSETLTGVLSLRNGQTWFVRYGDIWVLVLALLALVAPSGWPGRPGSVFPFLSASSSCAPPTSAARRWGRRCCAGGWRRRESTPGSVRPD
jgi:hypothetical protein